MTFDMRKMIIQPKGFFGENLNPSSVVNAENTDLTKAADGHLRNKPVSRHQ